MSIKIKKDWECDVCGKQTTTDSDDAPANWVKDANIKINFYSGYSKEYNKYFDFCNECKYNFSSKTDYKLKNKELSKPFWKKLLKLDV